MMFLIYNFNIFETLIFWRMIQITLFVIIYEKKFKNKKLFF